MSDLPDAPFAAPEGAPPTTDVPDAPFAQAAPKSEESIGAAVRQAFERSRIVAPIEAGLGLATGFGMGFPAFLIGGVKALGEEGRGPEGEPAEGAQPAGFAAAVRNARERRGQLAEKVGRIEAAGGSAPGVLAAEAGAGATYEPFTKKGRGLTEEVNAPFKALTEASVDIGHSVADYYDSPVAGALTESTIQMLLPLLGIKAGADTKALLTHPEIMRRIDDFLTGKGPAPKDFEDAATVLTGEYIPRDEPSPAAQKLGRIYDKTGKTPAQVLEAAVQDPNVMADLVADNRDVPKALLEQKGPEGAPGEAPAAEAPGAEAQSPANAPGSREWLAERGMWEHKGKTYERGPDGQAQQVLFGGQYSEPPAAGGPPPVPEHPGDTIEMPPPEAPTGLPEPFLTPEEEAASAPRAADPEQPLDINHPDVRNILQVMADRESGWAQIGGRHLGGKLGEPNFSTWIPRAEWWPDRPDKKMNEAKTQEAVRKALAGEPLKPMEQRTVDYMLELAKERVPAAARIGEPEWSGLVADLREQSMPPTTQNVVDVDLVARAQATDEAAVERAAVQHENDDAAFMAEVRRIANATEEPSVGTGEGGEAGERAPVRLERSLAQQQPFEPAARNPRTGLPARSPTGPGSSGPLADLTSLPRAEQPAAIGAAIRRRLMELGQGADEARANAAIWEAFFKTAGETYGRAPAELLAARGVDVRRLAEAENLPGTLHQQAAFFREGLAEHDDLFRYPISRELELKDITQDIDPDLKVRPLTEQHIAEASGGMSLSGLYGAKIDRVFEITQKGTKNMAEVIQTADGKVWINISQWEPGTGGSAVYAIVGDYAHNNRLKFIGDPNGLSPDALFRRTEAMSSTALRHGTTEHIEPHPKQVEGNAEMGVKPLPWAEGAHEANTESLLRAGYDNVRAHVPEIEGIDYKRDGRFIDRATGKPVGAADFQLLADQLSGGRAARAGPTTIKRAIVVGTLLRQGVPVGRPGLLGEVLRQSREQLDVPPAIRGLFQRSAESDQTQSPEFKKWFGDSKVVDAEGKPRTVYHGTTEDVNGAFGGLELTGWFSETPELAEEYATAYDPETDEPNIVPAYLAIKNPLDLTVEKQFDLTNGAADARELFERFGLDVKGAPTWLLMTGERLHETVNKEAFVKIAQAAGHDGIKALEEGHITWAIFKPEQVKSAIGNRGTFDPNSPDILKQEGNKPTGGERARIIFGKGKTFLDLLKNADESSFMHESAHLFLEITKDLVQAPEAPAAAKARWATLSEHIGIQPDEKTIPEAAHEKFADSWERYLQDGVAPTPELRTIFQQFRDWLLEIYHGLKDVVLSPEVKAVFDSMLRSQEADPAEPPAPPEPPRPAGSPPPSTPQQAVLDRISKDPGAKRRYTWSEFYADVKDELWPIKQLVDEMRKGGDLTTGQDPYKLARLTRGVYGKAEQALEYGMFDWNTYKNTGPSMKEGIDPVKNDLDGLRAYMLAKHAIETEAAGKKTGVPLDAARLVVAEGGKYEAAADALYKFQDGQLDWLVKAGIIAPAKVATWRAMYKAYIPLFRLMDDAQGAQGAGSGLKVRNPIMGRTGSERLIIDPLESIVKNTYLFATLADRNAVGRALVDLADKTGRTDLVQKIAQPAKPIKVQDEEIRKFLEDNGIEVDEEGTLEAMTIFRRGNLTPAEDQIVVFRDGKRELYQVPEEVATAFKATDRETAGMLTKILALPAKLLRVGATLSPDFIARNPVRDQFSAWVLSKSGYVPILDMTRGALSIARHDADFQNWLKSGGANAALVSLDRDYVQQELARRSGELGFADKVWNIVKNPLEPLRIASELMENATRLGEFKKAAAGLNSKEAIQAAGYEAREVTIDFARIGAKTRAMNLITAFWNANLEGIDRVVRALHDRPLPTTIAIATSITLPSVLLWYANHDDERYKQIPNWEKDLFWIVLTDKHIYRIPKPFELGVVFGSSVERILTAYADKNPEAFKDLWGSMVNTMGVNLVPTIASPIFGQIVNWNFFTDRPLIPASQEGILPEYQYSSYTTQTTRALGQLVGSIPGLHKSSMASPDVIDNYIRSWTGTLGNYALQIADAGLRKTGAIPDPVMPAKKLEDLPVLRGFMVRYPSGSAQSIQDFYDAYLDSKKVTDTIHYLAQQGDAKAALRELQLDQDSLFRIEGIHQGIANAQRVIQMVYQNQEIKPEEKTQLIDTMYFQMISMARAGNQALRAMKKTLEKSSGPAKEAPAVQDAPFAAAPQ